MCLSTLKNLENELSCKFSSQGKVRELEKSASNQGKVRECYHVHLPERKSGCDISLNIAFFINQMTYSLNNNDWLLLDIVPALRRVRHTSLTD